jgi:hypothetical protein
MTDRIAVGDSLDDLLDGCSSRSKTLAIASCESSAARQQPGQKLQDGNDIGSSMQARMKSHGYRFDIFNKTCREGIDS